MLTSFISLKPAIFAIFVTACYYGLTGLLYHYLDQKLFKQVIREYLFVFGFVGCIVLLSMPW
jgi:hypothetical protein